MNKNKQQELFLDYIEEVNSIQKESHTEFTYRPAIVKILNSLFVMNIKKRKIIAKNEIGKTSGNLDIEISENGVPIGHIETKDVGKNLRKVYDSKQLVKYKKNKPNLILTDYMSFWLIQKGIMTREVTIARRDKSGNIIPCSLNFEKFIKLLQDFTMDNSSTIDTIKNLATHVGRITMDIKNKISEDLTSAIRSKIDNNDDASAIENAHHRCEKILEQKLSVDEFADTSAQAIFAALFVSYCFINNDNKKFNINSYIENKYMISGIKEISDPFMVGPLSDIVKHLTQKLFLVLNKTNFSKVITQLKKDKGSENAIIYFFEYFLESYDYDKRKSNGWYLSPAPVTDFKAKITNQILTNCGFVNGIANTDKNANGEYFIQFLDPAIGTAAIIISAIKLANDILRQKYSKNIADYHIKEFVQKRIHGFDISVIAIGIASLASVLVLRNIGIENDDIAKMTLPYIAHNSLGYNEHDDELFCSLSDDFIKTKKNALKITTLNNIFAVIMANPPYSNNTKIIDKKIAECMKHGFGRGVPGYVGDNGATKGISDDYIKFMALAQKIIVDNDMGLCCFTTNHTYLDNPNFSNVRKSLLYAYSDIWVINCHGNTKSPEKLPTNIKKDENIFDIQAGISLIFALRRKGHNGIGKIKQFDLWGDREYKFKWFDDNDISTIEWNDITPIGPYYMFYNSDTNNESVACGEYCKFVPLNEIFNTRLKGVGTRNDKLAYYPTIIDVKSFVQICLKDSTTTQTIVDYLNYENHEKINKALYNIKNDKGIMITIEEREYRPFTPMYIIDRPYLIKNRRHSDWLNMKIKNNYCLCVNRQLSTQSSLNAYVTNKIPDFHLVQNSNASPCFVPLMVYNDENMFDKSKVKSNFNDNFIDNIVNKFKVKYVGLSVGDEKNTIGDIDIFGYIVGVYSSQYYIEKFNDLLKTTFARIPIFDDFDLFMSISKLGRQIINIETRQLPLEYNTCFPISGSNIVERPSYKIVDNIGLLFINKTQYFKNVTKKVWEFTIGDHKVCSVWLKHMKKSKHPLDIKQIDELRYVIAGIEELSSIIKNIDNIIRKNDNRRNVP